MQRVEEVALLGIGAEDGRALRRPVTSRRVKPTRGSAMARRRITSVMACSFGPVGAQEFQPRGGGKEQVAQFDHRAARQGGGLDGRKAAAFAGDLRGLVARRRAR